MNTLRIKITEPVLSMTLEELDLSQRAINCMKRGKLHTVEDVLDNQHKLATIKSCGATTIKEIKNKIFEAMLVERTKEM